MHDYEIMVVLQPDLDEGSVKAILDKINGWITDAGGSVTKTDIWGKRRLANRIKKMSEGVYVLLNAMMPPAFTHDLERNLLYNESILRFLITTPNK